MPASHSKSAHRVAMAIFGGLGQALHGATIAVWSAGAYSRGERLPDYTAGGIEAASAARSAYRVNRQGRVLQRDAPPHLALA